MARSSAPLLHLAFRFLEVQTDEIPASELVTILERRCAFLTIPPPYSNPVRAHSRGWCGRCAIPASFAAKMVAVMGELQRRRSSSRVFAGKADEPLSADTEPDPTLDSRLWRVWY